jgi:hypothetical protein
MATPTAQGIQTAPEQHPRMILSSCTVFTKSENTVQDTIFYF